MDTHPNLGGPVRVSRSRFAAHGRRAPFAPAIQRLLALALTAVMAGAFAPAPGLAGPTPGPGAGPAPPGLADRTASSPARSSGVITGCRWASGVVGFSSQWSSLEYSAQQALGPPDTYSDYGDLPTAWASSTENGQREFLVLSFVDPAPINYVNVYETWGPGAIELIAVKNPGSGLFETVWTGTAATAPHASRVFTATFPETPFAVSEVRIELDSPAVPLWNEIDAVAIGLCDFAAQSEWATSVVEFSSQYHDVVWSAQQATGAPNTPFGSDNSTAWASLTENGQREHLVLVYDPPRVINFVSVYEAMAPGATDIVSVKNPGTGLFETVWTATAAPAGPVASGRILTASFPVTQFPVTEVRISLNSPAVPYWNEIDAVGIGRCVCSDRLVDVGDGAPAATSAPALAAPRPNPFRGSTEIGFALPRDAHVRIEVFNMLGRRVVRLLDRAMPAGRHAVSWTGLDEHGRQAPSGIYHVTADVAGARQSRRVVKIE